MTLHLTDGHPASTRLLVDAVAERPEHRDESAIVLDQPEVLDPHRTSTTERRRTVAERMRELLADYPDEITDDLVTCAASRERQHALRLADSGLLTPSRQNSDVSSLAAVLWPPVHGASPVLLRRLLLRELARRKKTKPPEWSTVFHWHRKTARKPTT